jgi:transcriptional regulator GlxA family with amidase domain
LGDIMMPVMKETEMPRRIKNNNHTSQIPVVMMTARADISSKLSGIEKGADSFLLKQFDVNKLQPVLKNLIVKRRKNQERYVSVNLHEIRDRTEVSLDGQFMQKVFCLMDTNIDDDQFGIAELCEALGMSRAQIYRKFKLLTDRTPHDYLRSYRLQRAKELLLTTKLKVSEVAYRTGFKNVSHFSRIFAEEFGKNPGKLSR